MTDSPVPHDEDPHSTLKTQVDSTRMFFIRMTRVIPTLLGVTFHFPLLRYVCAPAFTQQTFTILGGRGDRA